MLEWWFGAMPWVLGSGWVVHAVLSWCRPDRMNPVGRLLLVGLPVAAIVLGVLGVVWPNGDARGLELIGTTGFGLILVAFKMMGCWLVVLVLECLLAPTRRARCVHAARVAL